MFNYLLFILAGCPAPLQVDESRVRDSTAIEPIIPDQLGIIKTDSCDQENIGSSVCNLIFYDQNCYVNMVSLVFGLVCWELV